MKMIQIRPFRLVSTVHRSFPLYSSGLPSVSTVRNPFSLFNPSSKSFPTVMYFASTSSSSSASTTTQSSSTKGGEKGEDNDDDEKKQQIRKVIGRGSLLALVTVLPLFYWLQSKINQKRPVRVIAFTCAIFDIFKIIL